MTLPETGPATLPAVKAFLGGSYSEPDSDDTDDSAIQLCVDAVNVVVRGWPCAFAADGLPDWSTAANVVQGSVMLAGRLFRRRNSPDGVAAFAGDQPLYVQRNDPDVSLLLKLGPNAKPSVG